MLQKIHDLHDFKQILSDGDGMNADLCVPRQKEVHEMVFFLIRICECTAKTLLNSWITSGNCSFSSSALRGDCGKSGV